MTTRSHRLFAFATVAVAGLLALFAIPRVALAACCEPSCVFIDPECAGGLIQCCSPCTEWSVVGPDVSCCHGASEVCRSKVCKGNPCPQSGQTCIDC